MKLGVWWWENKNHTGCSALPKLKGVSAAVVANVHVPQNYGMVGISARVDHNAPADDDGLKTVPGSFVPAWPATASTKYCPPDAFVEEAGEDE